MALANALRALAMDAVQQANSGHPGMPMGMADIAEVLWNDFLRHNPANPHWPDRDRFVVSNGHGSMLLYALLHLSGYALPLDELKRFRQLHSKTPGHPEYGQTPGVETTTGPLGQGLANAVGMAIAEQALGAQFNREGHALIDHYTYALVGDGCLMEGISHESCSLAGTLGLGKLIVIYDDNGVSIDGAVGGWFRDDTAARFRAYRWHVVPDVDGHDPATVRAAIAAARAATDRPSLVICKTVIGWGSPNKQGTAACHGAALGPEEIRQARERLGWTHAPFVVPDHLYRHWDARERGARWETEWNQRYTAYRTRHPELARELDRRLAGALPDHWGQRTREFVAAAQAKAEAIATRKASLNALNAYAPLLPELMGGSADLTESNLTLWSGAQPFSANARTGRYIYYGVREFAMSAIQNGLALHRGILPFGGTFLVFSDYARNALRMAAIMGLRNIFVYTHDSIGLGEDGPTHQAVEHAPSLRLIPNLSMWRPCDAAETAVAWKAAIERSDGPTALLLSRQNLAPQWRSEVQLQCIERGGYVLYECAGAPEAILIATGSEVELAMGAARQLSEQGRRVRVVSMPSCDVFEQQDAAYRESVLPRELRRRLAIEASSADYWYRYVGLDGRVLGLRRFGESAPGEQVMQHLGFTVAAVIEQVQALFD